jgi:hypothetical protein
MNIIDIQDQLKNFSEDQLINEMQMPSGNAPQFLVLSEIQRRKRVRDDFSKRQAAQQPTVAEEAIAAAGVPQSGIAGMSEAMAPKSTMVQNAVGSAMPEAMRSGGLVQFGNDIKRRLDNQEVDPFLDEVEDMAESRFNVDFSGPPNFGMGGARPPGFPSKGGPPTVRPAIARLPDDLEQQFVKTVFNSPSQGGIGSLAVPTRMKDGGLVDALFSKTDHGKKLSSNQFEVRKGKDGRRMVYKKGTNIFVGTADKVFDEKYDGGLIRAQDGLPRGLRLNNPGNIRPGAGFFGEIGDDGGYAEFDSDAAGIRAIQRLLKTYGNQYGINTLRGLANRYAPPSDNNPTDNYIEFLSQQTGIDPDEPINLAERGSEIIPAIIGFEQGQQPFSQDMINKAIGAAQFDDEEDIKSALFPQELIDAGVSPSDLAQADQSPGLMSAMAATSGSSPTPQQDYLAGQLSDGPFDAEGRRRRQAPNRVETDPKGSGGRNDPEREAPDPNRPPVVLEPGDTTKGRNIARTKDSRIEDAKAARKRAEDAAKAAEKAAKEEVTEQPTTTDPEPPKEPDAPKTSGLSSIEEEILALQKQMQKDRESDKWLAIAQAGLALMSSNNPTLLGAAGEAGIEGLKAFREANDRYQEGVIDLLNARSKLAKNRTGLTQNQANQLAVDYEKIANDMSVDEQTRLRARILAEQLRMQGGLGMGLMAGNYDIATPSS